MKDIYTYYGSGKYGILEKYPKLDVVPDKSADLSGTISENR